MKTLPFRGCFRSFLDGGIGFDKNTTPFGAFGNLMFKSFESIMDSNHLTFRFTSHGKFGDGSYCAILTSTARSERHRDIADMAALWPEAQ